MKRKETSDGIRLTKILRLAEDLGVDLRTGRKHKYILNYPNLRGCPVAPSSDAKKMIAPWLSQVSGRTRQETYNAMKKGYFE